MPVWRRAQAVDCRSDRTRHATAPARAARDGPGGAVRHRRAVVGERDVEQHDASRRFMRPPIELVVSRHHEQIGFEPFREACRRCCRDPSMAQPVRVRRHDLERLAPAHPPRHLHRLGADVLQAVVAHRAHGPGDRVLERARAAQPVAERVGELRQAVPGGRVGERRADQAGSRLAIGIEPGSRRCGGAAAALRAAATAVATNSRRLRGINAGYNE